MSCFSNVSNSTACIGKFGVETKELPDGLEVYGKPIEDLVQNVSVHCYDDHRVAMAFSVLGTVVRGTILEEKRCVEKTWPDFWDSLENKVCLLFLCLLSSCPSLCRSSHLSWICDNGRSRKLIFFKQIGIKVEGVELSPASSLGSPSKYASKDTVPSVVLIGMRGSGKTFVGGLGGEYNCGDVFLFCPVLISQYQPLPLTGRSSTPTRSSKNTTKLVCVSSCKTVDGTRSVKPKPRFCSNC